MEIDPNIKRQLEQTGYRIYKWGSIEICHWTKEAIRNRRFCYKNKFYGIDTHRCMQISLATFWCTNRCIYCWRPNQDFQDRDGLFLLDLKDVPDPKEMLEKLKEYRRELLIGFGGNPDVDKEFLKEALEPNHVTFSLMGEPLLYPKMPEAIKYIKENWNLKSIFIVSNGMVPEMIERLINENALPTQFYISFTAPNKELYEKISKPLVKDYWERFLKTLDLLRNAKTRKVARITLIKGLNDCCFEGWKKLIERFNPHFVEVKAYMFLGYSRFRLKKENQPTHEEVKEFALKILKYLKGFEYMDEHEPSRVVVLKNKTPGMDIDPIIRSVEPNVE